MHVICCYKRLHPKTAESVVKYAPQAEFIETPHLFSYNEVIGNLWGKDDLVVIEGDKEITADVIPSFEACPKPWCMYSYENFPAPYTTEIYLGLGCTKFSIEIQRQIPVMEFLWTDDTDWPTCPDCNGLGCWRYLDTRIVRALFVRQVIGCLHGRINHHHPYPDNFEMNFSAVRLGEGNQITASITNITNR